MNQNRILHYVESEKNINSGAEEQFSNLICWLCTFATRIKFGHNEVAIRIYTSQSQVTSAYIKQSKTPLKRIPFKTEKYF